MTAGFWSELLLTDQEDLRAKQNQPIFPRDEVDCFMPCFHEYCTSYIVEIPAHKKIQVVVKKVLKMELI